MATRTPAFMKNKDWDQIFLKMNGAASGNPELLVHSASLPLKPEQLLNEVPKSTPVPRSMRGKASAQRRLRQRRESRGR